MIFNLLNYLQPTHYFSLSRNDGSTVFPDVSKLPERFYSKLEVDLDYQSTIAKNYDLSWQAIHKGYIGDTPTYAHFEPVPTIDQYRFIRKYFHPTWVFYVFILRLISFHNPFKEFHSWFKTQSVRRSSYLTSPITYDKWKNYNSNLIEKHPKVSVIIPTLNRYSYLADVLRDFEHQDYTHFEVIIVDQSDDFDPEFYKQFKIEIQLIQQTEKALWLARNTAIKHATGSLIAFSEDDVRLQANWISKHIKCLDFFKAKVSAGVFYPEGQHIPSERSFFTIASQFATGNAMVYRDVFKLVGLFDRQFEKQRMGDGEFGLRCYMNSLRCVSNPYASCIDLKAPVGGLRQFGSWDAFRTSKLFAPRPIPSVLYFFRRYFGTSATRLSLLKTIPLSIMPYKFKKHKFLLIFGVFFSIFILPLVLFQVYTSWSLSSKKLQEGPLIDPLS